MMRITAGKITACGTASTVVVDYHRVFFVRVKMRRQVVASANGVTTGVDKVPRLAFTQQHILQFPIQIFFQLRGILLQINHIQAVRVGRTFSVERQRRSFLGYRESQYHFFGHIHLLNVFLCRIQAEQRDTITVFCGEVHTIVYSRPYRLHHVRIECPGQRFNLLALQIHQVKLIVNHARGLSFLHVLTDAPQTLRCTGQQYLTAVGRELRIGQETVIFHQFFHLQGLHIHLVHREQSGRAFSHTVVGSHHQDKASVGGDIRSPYILVTEGQRLAHACLHIKTGQVRTVAPSRLAIVRVNELIDFLLLFRSLLYEGKQQIILRRCYLEAALRQMVHPHFLASGGRVYRHQFPAGYSLTYIVIFHGTRHPVQGFSTGSDYFSSLQFLYLSLRSCFSTFLCDSVRRNQVFPIS